MAERLVPAGAEFPPLQTLEDAYPRTTPQARANRHRADRPRYTAPGETGQDGSVAGRRLPIGMNTQRAARSPAHAFGLPACPPHVNLQNDRVESYTEPAADSYRVHAPLPLGRKRGAGGGADHCRTQPQVAGYSPAPEPGRGAPRRSGRRCADRRRAGGSGRDPRCARSWRRVWRRRDQLAQLRDASGGQFVDQFQQLLTQRRIVDPCRGGPRAVEQQAAWPPSPIAEQVAADAALPDPVLLLVAALLGAFVDLRQQRIEQHLDQVHEDAALSGHLQGTDGRCTAVETHREHAMER